MSEDFFKLEKKEFVFFMFLWCLVGFGIFVILVWGLYFLILAIVVSFVSKLVLFDKFIV